MILPDINCFSVLFGRDDMGTYKQTHMSIFISNVKPDSSHIAFL